MEAVVTDSDDTCLTLTNNKAIDLSTAVNTNIVNDINSSFVFSS